MGIFVNSDNSAFQVALNSEIYIDKTELIAYTNKKKQRHASFPYIYDCHTTCDTQKAITGNITADMKA